MNSIISINELALGSFFLFCCFFLSAVLKRSMGLLLFAALILCFIFSLMFNKSWKRDLPSKCTRNPFGFIEIHIGEECSGMLEFLKICLQTIEVGINEKKNILADTWLIKKSNVEDMLGNSVEVLNPGILQSLSNISNKLKHDRKSKRKSIRFVIHVDRVNVSHIKSIEGKINRLEHRQYRISNGHNDERNKS